MEDHLHLLAALPATLTIADAASVLKSNSSRWIHDNISGLAGFAWQRGYSAFSVSKSNEPAVKRYIDGQEKHHRRLSYKEELLAMLEKHGIEYDERYLWA